MKATKIKIVCKDEQGKIVCGIVTRNVELAKEYAIRKNMKYHVDIITEG